MICPWCEKETEVQEGFCARCGLEIPKEFGSDREEVDKKSCHSCSGSMMYYGNQTLQLGSYGFFTGHLDTSFQEALR